MLIALLLLAAPDFEIEYASYVPPKYEVFVFLATECPMAKLYGNRLSELADRYPQVHFQGISANENDTDAEIAEFQRNLRFGFRRNPEAITKFGATRSPEAVLVMNGNVIYQGRIDDQYTPGTNRSQPTRDDLEEAIKDTLAGRPLAVSRTKATGCHITVPKKRTGDLTFEDVAPILHGRCASCHRPGEVAPCSLLTHKDASGWAAMIREVVSNNRMPPWHANPKHGKFANDRSLTAAEKELLLRWIDSGSPAGRHEPVLPTFKEGWSIRPDLVLEAEKPFLVPAEGVLDYQEIVFDPGFTKDTCVQAVEIQPGNKSVVHHINLFLRPKDARKGSHYPGDMQDAYFAMMVPGTTVTKWPDGIAKIIPAGFQVALSIHYQPNGTPQDDQSSFALQFADLKTVRQKLATRVLQKDDLKIAPNNVVTATQEWTLEEDYTLYALYPHMHLRGRSMRFEIVDGPVLLDVPHYDFNWQHRYVLAEPLKLYAGTVIRCTAAFDNTRANPNNPDPNVTVTHGVQSTDEMFQACFEIVRTNEDRLEQTRSPMLPMLAVLTVAFIGFCFRRRTK
jgi:hypothetical protein